MTQIWLVTMSVSVFDQRTRGDSQLFVAVANSNRLPFSPQNNAFFSQLFYCFCSRLFCDIGCVDFCIVTNVMKLNGTSLVSQTAKENMFENISFTKSSPDQITYSSASLRNYQLYFNTILFSPLSCRSEHSLLLTVKQPF